jgi:deoxyribodipyrimidine photo-lyase
MKIDIFIFRRDFRLHDNSTLLLTKNPVIPIFIFNKDQITKDNEYYNQRIIDFMCSALNDLNNCILKKKGKLYCFYSEKQDTFTLDSILKELNAKNISCQGIYSNKDITPYALKRDNDISSWCKTKGIPFIQNEDYTLFSPEKIRNKSGKPFKVITPFKNKVITLEQPKIQPEYKGSFCIFSFKKYNILPKYFLKNENKDATREFSLKKINQIKDGYYKKYSKERDHLHPTKTTRLAPYLKFGLVSIRQAYNVSIQGNGKTDQLTTEILIKEFYNHLSYHYPEVLHGQINKQNKNFKSRFDKIKWVNNKEHINAFYTGNTGIPLVDAGIRQLLQSGYMHNRVRMIVGSFLVKNLFIDWRIGEKFFAKHLLDYDPIANNAGWQWVASTGTDTQPYRIFSPVNQTKTYDPKAEYILNWIPELRSVPVKDILVWHKVYNKYNTYKKPIVDTIKSGEYAKKYLKSI